jgi:hypothetical protein
MTEKDRKAGSARSDGFVDSDVHAHRSSHGNRWKKTLDPMWHQKTTGFFRARLAGAVRFPALVRRARRGERLRGYPGNAVPVSEKAAISAAGNRISRAPARIRDFAGGDRNRFCERNPRSREGGDLREARTVRIAGRECDVTLWRMRSVNIGVRGRRGRGLSRIRNHPNNDGQSDPGKILNDLPSPGAPLFTRRVVRVRSSALEMQGRPKCQPKPIAQRILSVSILSFPSQCNC